MNLLNLGFYISPCIVMGLIFMRGRNLQGMVILNDMMEEASEVTRKTDVDSVLCRCAVHCLAMCLYMSTHNVYTLRDLYFTLADQCRFSVRSDITCYFLTCD